MYIVFTYRCIYVQFIRKFENDNVIKLSTFLSQKKPKNILGLDKYL